MPYFCPKCDVGRVIISHRLESIDANALPEELKEAPNVGYLVWIVICTECGWKAEVGGDQDIFESLGRLCGLTGGFAN